jgi:CPA2 family monovalent cation:H+ antiporter-2
MEIPLLGDVVVIFGLAIIVVYISHMARLPVIVGLLLTGVLAGPNALGLIDNLKEVDMLAKIGVVLLLFTIGIEFSLSKLMKIKTLVLVGGALQVAGTVGVVFIVTRYLFGWDFGNAVFMGFLISLSSTAIVLKVLQERAEIESAQGRISLGMLIYQDVIVVLFIILTPFLAGATEQAKHTVSPWQLIFTGLGLIVFVIVGSQYIVPWILHQVVRTRSHELFLLTIGGICFAVAYIAADLSLALGAFLAGLTISESEYSHEAFEHILPFRDIFTSFFFVSVGMLLDFNFIVQNPFMVISLTVMVLLLKTIITTSASFILGYSLKTALISGLILCQVGEFAFVLAKVGREYHLLTDEANQMFLAMSVLSMAATSFINAAPYLADQFVRLPMPNKLRQGLYPLKDIQQPSSTKQTFQDHLIIVGYGINGHNVAQAAQRADVPYVVLEMNPDTVRQEQKKGSPVFYGDAGQEAVLKHINIEVARMVVVAIADATSTRHITGVARKLNPSVYIIARTRYLSEVEPLYKIGADEVIPEEFETSVQIFSRVLSKYLVPQHEIHKLVMDIRAQGYKSWRLPISNTVG